VILDETEALLDPVSDIEGFMLACLVDASTGMVLASRKDQDDISLPTTAAGAAEVANVLFIYPVFERQKANLALAGLISGASRTTSRSKGSGRRTSPLRPRPSPSRSR
jgi:hypothetical protein